MLSNQNYEKHVLRAIIGLSTKKKIYCDEWKGTNDENYGLGDQDKDMQFTKSKVLQF